MKRLLTTFVVVSIGLSLHPKAVFATAPDHLDFIFLVDVSGSMEFDFDGDHPVPLADQRISYVKPALEVLGPFVSDINDAVTPFSNVTKVRFALAIFPGDAPEKVTWKAGTATNLLSWNEVTFNSTLTSLTTRWAGTPIKTALNAADALWGADPPTTPHGKVIFLLTDGKSYGETGVTVSIGADIDVGSVMIGTGDETAPDFLDDFCHGSTASPCTDSDCVREFVDSDPIGPITKYFIQTFFDYCELDWVTVTDPTFVMTSEDVDTFAVDVTKYDERLYFTTTWQTPRQQNRVLFNIDAPGATLTPTSPTAGVKYTEGDTYATYSIAPEFLETHLGTWQLRIDGSPLPPRIRQLTSYVVGGPSSLQVHQDRTPGNVRLTGDSLPLVFYVTAKDDTVPGVRMRAEIRMPTQALGNWFATNVLTRKETEKMFSLEYPGHVDDAFRKSHYLRTVKNIERPGYSTITLDLHDDGAHGDGASGDGVFGNSLPPFNTPGTYRVHLFVEGDTPDGAPFTREVVRNYFVVPKIENDWVASSLDVSFVADTGRGKQYDLRFVPRDRLGNYVLPGHGDDVKVGVSGGRAVDDIRDDLEGGYIQRIEVDAGAKAPTVEVSFGDTRFPPRELPEPGRPCGLSVAALVGYFVFDSALDIDDAPTYALRLRKCLMPRLGVEAEFAVTPTDDVLGNSGLVMHGNINLAYRIAEWRKGLVYVAGGGGWAGFRDFATDEDIASVNFGVGGEVGVSRSVSLLLEGKDDVMFDAYSTGTTHNLQVLLGVAYR